MTETVVRKASGVRREASTWDVFWSNNLAGALGIAVAWVLILGPAFYPGADIVLSTVICGILSFFMLFSYYALSVAMPRSGGEYVFVSRVIHPLVGFVASFNFSIWNIVYMAASATFAGYMGLAPLLDSVGRSLGSETLVAAGAWAATNVGYFTIGTVLIVLVGLVLVWGLRPTFRLMMIVSVIAIVSTVAVVVLLATANQASFVAGFNERLAPVVGSSYQEIIDAAKGAGWATQPANLASTLTFMVWPFWAFGFLVLSGVFGSEIKRVEKSQLVGMIGCYVFTFALTLLAVVAALAVIGYDFLGAVGFNWYVQPQYSTPIMPWIGYLTTALTDNVWLISLIGLGWVMWAYSWIPSNIFYGSRAFFAWALDRLLPEWTTRVYRRVPLMTILLAGIVAEVLLALFSFTPYLTLQTGVVGLVITQLIVCISAVLLPFRRKDLFEKSPFKHKIAGIPILSIIGLIGAISMSYLLYIFSYDEISAANTLQANFFQVGILVAGAVLFLVARYIRKRQGINIDLYFKEIPTE